MLDHSEYDRWRKAADGAQRSAQLQAQSDQHNWACFLAEQAAQLAVKGLVHGLGLPAWGHDLVRLGGSVEAGLQQPLPDAVTAALRALSRHYIPARYPDAHPSGPPSEYYGREDVDRALVDLQVILAEVDSIWTRLNASPEGSNR